MPRPNMLEHYRDEIVRSLRARLEEGVLGWAKLSEEDRALVFLSALVQMGRGQVSFGETENGDVGVWIFPGSDEGEHSAGGGDTAEEALLDALSQLRLQPGELE